MIYNIRKIFTLLSVMVLGGVLVYNCEPEPDSLGEQLFLNGAAEGVESSYDLIAYNLKNNDTIRTDAFKLLNVISSSSTSSTAVLGAFNESQFGMQRASYFTQVRLAADNPDFGTNAVVDSVVLVLKPIVSLDSIKTTTKEDYIFPDGNVDAKKVVNTYPIKKYGKAKLNGGKLTLQVKEVTDFMNGVNDVVYSDKNFATSTVLGSKEISGDASAVIITKDSDGSSLFTANTGIRIPLSASVFQSKIIDKKGQPELSDVSNFIRHFRGLKISLTDTTTDGYLFQFAPNEMELIMYYKNDKLVDNVNTRPQTKYEFAVKGTNVHSAYYEYDRSGSPLQNPNNLGNTTIGDQKLYAQGMGGNSIGIKFKKEEIDKLRKLYQDDKAAIISAKIRIYTDEIDWAKPYPKPGAQDFTIVQRDKDTAGKETTAFTTDYTSLGATFIPVRAYNTDKNPTSYEFTVTRSLKDIVESNPSIDYSNRYFKIDLAYFLPNASGTIAGYNYTSRAFSMGRTVFVGSNSSSDKKIKLLVTYGTKK